MSDNLRPSVPQPPPPTARPGPPDRDDQLADASGGLASLMLGATVLFLTSLIPVVALGGLGILLITAGTTETTNVLGQTETDFDRTGVVGMSLVCAAVAWFFGRGTIGSLSRVARGQGGLFESLTVGWTLRHLGITVIALLLMLLSAGGVFGLGPFAPVQ